MINPFVKVARADWTESVVSDDNGGGVLGASAHVDFTAPDSGIYIVLVSDTQSRSAGGYFLKIDGAPRQAVSPTPTQAPAIPPVSSPHGLMATYDNARVRFLHPVSRALDRAFLR